MVNDGNSQAVVLHQEERVLHARRRSHFRAYPLKARRDVVCNAGVEPDDQHRAPRNALIPANCVPKRVVLLLSARSATRPMRTWGSATVRVRAASHNQRTMFALTLKFRTTSSYVLERLTLIGE